MEKLVGYIKVPVYANEDNELYIKDPFGDKDKEEKED